MRLTNNESLKIAGFVIIYFIGILTLYFLGLNYFEYILAYALMILSYFYITYFLAKNDLKNKYLTSLFFIGLLFFWLRLPFIFKSDLISPDFNILYKEAMQFLNKRIPLIRISAGYGPIFYLCLFIPALLTGGDYFAIKFFFVLLDFLNLIMIYLIANEMKFKANYKICLLYALLPFGIIEFAWNGHNDTGMVLLILVSVYFLLKNKVLFSSIFILMAVVYKFYAAFFIPIYLIYLYKKSGSKSNLFKNFFWFFSPIIAVGGAFVFIYPSMIFGFLNTILSHITRSATLGLLSTINLTSYVNGIAGFIIFNPINTGLLGLFLTTNAIDLYNVGSFFKISWLILGILLLFAFRNHLNKPIYDILVFSPIIIYVLNVLFNLEIPLGWQYALNFGVLIVGLIYFYFFVFKPKEFKRDDLIPSLFYTIMIFLAIYHVIYPWYYLWAIPFILIFFNRMKQSSYVLITVTMYAFVLAAGRFFQITAMELSIIILIIIFALNIILFLKLLEYKAHIDNSAFPFSKINRHLPKFLDFDMKGLYMENKPYNEILFVILLISFINVILLNFFFILLLPKISFIDPFIKILGINTLR